MTTPGQPQEPVANLRGLQRWWLRRLPRTNGLQLDQHNLYILPTRAGWMLALTLLLLLVGSINYQLNLGYLLTFMLTGCAAVSVLVTHRNLHGMRLQWQASGEHFAGQPLQLRVQLRNESRWGRHAIALHCMGLASQPRGSDCLLTWTDVPAHDSVSLDVQGPPLPRGHWVAPAMHAESNFPLGIFRTWCWWRPAANLLVYPAPELGAPPLPTPGTQPDDPPSHAVVPDTNELDDLRTYRAGDPPKHLLWKKVAQHPDAPEHWSSRDFSPASGGGKLWLDSSRCGLLDREGQLSRLCAWVLQAEQQRWHYGLRLPHMEIAPGLGTQHRQRCLEALACA